MFVLHALVLTFITTPLTLAFYPERARRQNEPDSDSGLQKADTEALERRSRQSQESYISHFSIVLEKIEQLPAVMTFTQLLRLPATTASPDHSQVSLDTKDNQPATPPGLPFERSRTGPAPSRIHLDALRLIELTNRTSAVLKSQFADSLVLSDPVLAVVRTFGSLNSMAVSTALAIVGYEDYSSSVAEHVKKTSSQMVVLPWSTTSTSLEDVVPVEGSSSSPIANPVVNLSSVQAQTFRKVFLAAPNDVALFIDRGLSQDLDEHAGQHIFLPFVGGPDDRLALSFVVQLCMNPSTSATVIRFSKTDAHELATVNSLEKPDLHNTLSVSFMLYTLMPGYIMLTMRFEGFPDTVYAVRDTQTRIASETADNIQWEKYLSSTEPGIARSLSRITFQQETPTLPLRSMLDAASNTFAQFPRSRPIVVLGRSRRMAVESHAAELASVVSETGAVLSSETTKTVGDVGAAFVAKSVNASLLVLQASSS